MSDDLDTRTIYDDTGRDCDHCGGVIMKRTDRQRGRRDLVTFQCDQCECKWTNDGRKMRAGKLPICKKEFRRGRGKDEVDDGKDMSPIVQTLLAIGGIALFIFILVRGGIFALRLMVPIVLLVLVGVVGFRWGRENGRW